MHISVITTTYNCGQYILEAINSILNQTFKKFEYLIIDDGSTDNTNEIISKISDDRIRYFKIEHFGRSKALNFGISKTKYDIVALMDADDISHPLRFEKQLKILSSENQFIFCNTAYFSNNKIKYVIKNDDTINYRKKLILHGHFNNSSSLFNKYHIIKNGGYNENLYAYEDYELWTRIINVSEFIICHEIYHYMRLREDSMTTSNPNKLKHILYSIQENNFQNLPKYGIELENEQLLLRGWREFFYGNLKLSRKYWAKMKPRERTFKTNIAFYLSFLPSKFVELLKKNRILLRIKYFFYQIKSYNKIQKEFNRIFTDFTTNFN